MAESAQMCTSAHPDDVTIRRLGSRFWFVAGVFMVTDVLDQPFLYVFAIIPPAKGTRRFAMTRSSSRRNRKLENDGES